MNRNQSIRLKNTLLAASGGVILSLGLLYAFVQGYTSLTHLSISLILSFFWFVTGGVVLAIVLGWNERLKDPSLSLLQMYWGSITAALSLLVTWNIDALFYLLALLPFVFGVFRLQIKQFHLYTVVVVIILFLVVVVRSLIFSREPGLVDSLVVWSSFSFCAYTLSSLCRSVVRLQNRLREKNDQLQHALQARTYFLSNMSHEIRTPMNGVLGMIEISLTKELNEEVRHHLLIAKESGRALLTVIADILDFSKIESGKLTLEPSNFDLHHTLEEVVASFKAIVSKKNLQLNLSCDEQTPKYICADASRLRQILTNLIANAIKFTEHGKIKLSVAPLLSESIQEGVCKLTFSVEDTGIGIAADKIDLLFEHFTQADASATRRYGGTGLGLAISKNLCELMGGEIVVASELGRGSTFKFSIVVTSVEQSDASDRVGSVESDAAPNRRVWDEAALLKVVGGKHHRIDRLFNAFAENLDTLVAEMQQSFRVSDFDQLSKQAHGLKGASGNLRFDRLADTCKLIEVSARQQSEGELLGYMDDLLVSVSDVKNILSRG